MRWLATLLVVGCHFGDAVPVPDAPPDMTGIDVPTDCAPGYTQQSGHFYLLAPQNAWAATRAFCLGTSARADLAFPTDAATLQLMSDIVGPGRDYWIGIDDAMNPGTFVTVAGTVATYLPWAVGEPTSQGNCVRVTQGAFATQKCDIKLSALCECFLQ